MCLVGYVEVVRFSPVGTGNTMWSNKEQRRKTVQPRGYGEH